MVAAKETLHAWKQCASLDDAYALVDIGVILGWADVRRVVRDLGQEGTKSLVQRLAVRLAERYDNRLAMECAAETVLVILAAAADEKMLMVFLESYLEQPGCSDSAFPLVEVALTSEPSEAENDDETFATAVSVVCEMGLAIRQLEQTYPGQVRRAPALLAHIATYLLSVSNSNNNCIRLSLLNYFGSTGDVAGFNKIMGRFGHTILDHLFHLLFRKKSEGVALQFLLENTPYVLLGDRHAQRIVHETWKFYMLKKSDRFGLFIQTLAKNLKERQGPDAGTVRRVYCQHLGALLAVASEVNHRGLAQEIICGLVPFRNDPLCMEVVSQIIQSRELRANFHEILVSLRDEKDAEKVIESASRFVASKRGRKPSFQQLNGLLTVHQVQFLGHQPVAKAS